MDEFKRMLRKHPFSPVSSFMANLFTGTGQNDPKTIVSSEDGLDIRNTVGGQFGEGIHLSTNSAQAH